MVVVVVVLQSSKMQEMYGGAYFEEPDEQDDGLALHVHLLAAVELLPDVLHVLAVARLPKHSLRGRALLPQQRQHLLARKKKGRT